MLAYPKLAPAIPAIGYWLFSLFYLMAELWGNVAVALLFWQALAERGR
jgi:AAA family ATP:ADP antiporter